MRCASIHLWTAGILFLLATTVLAEDYVNESRTLAAPPHSTTEQFTFTIDKDSSYPHFELSIEMTQGRADLRVFDPEKRKLLTAGAQICTVGHPIPSATTPGTYTVELTTTEAIGQWYLRIYGGSAPPKPPLGPGLAGAGAMMLIATASVWFWRWRTGVAWRWFWVGAGVWTVAVAVKLAVAIPLNKPILEGLKASLPHWAYLATGTIYGGVMTGITEILFTLIAALSWRQMTASAARGGAVGVGAGAFEAALLAIGIASAVATGEGHGPATWPVVLAPATERLITILCHTASRALVLLAVARRRWILFWCGFLLLSGLDAVPTILQISGRVGMTSLWTMDALIAPFGLISIPITIWCIRHWPSVAGFALPPTQGQAADRA